MIGFVRAGGASSLVAISVFVANVNTTCTF